ncbi:MAG: S1C family serine protease [Truepera sp.]|nr:S1C family serine protease [Truepera sp.]
MIPEPELRRSRGQPFGRAILPLLLLAVAAVVANELRTERVVAQDMPPPVVEATGQLEEVYQGARPATLRVEARIQGWRDYSVLGVGTGFFVSEEGLLLTAYHVVEAQRSGSRPIYYVGESPGGEEYRLELVGFDAYLDLALLQAEVDGPVPYIPFASGPTRPGREIVAIGNSRGEFLEDRSGRVTRLGVGSPNARLADGVIELTASLIQGDSGGPVLNTDGEVVGVVSYISFNPQDMSAEGPEFIPPLLRGLTLPRRFASYAVPVFEGSEVVAALFAGESRDIPVIGFWWDFDYDPATNSSLDLGRRPGPVIRDIAAGGPAARAGLRSRERRPVVVNREGRPVHTWVISAADVIVAVDGEPTPTFNSLVEVLRRKEVGQLVELTVQRGAETFKVDLELGALRQLFN